jgi:hypothetical protein
MRVDHTRDIPYKSNNFYIFNVIGNPNSEDKGDRNDPGNLFSLFLPRFDAANVAVLEWDPTPSDILTDFRTLNFLKDRGYLKLFGSAFFLNNGVRGPFVGNHEGRWLHEYRKLLFTNLGSNSKIGMLGPTLSCEISPHVQTHAFMLREEVFPMVLKAYSQYYNISDRLGLIRHYEVRCSICLFYTMI